MIVEIQLDARPEKQLTWPQYVTSLRVRHGCPVLLLVVCVDATTARWAAGPIDTGHPGFVLRPIVLGPDSVPVVTDPAAVAATPELVLLSAIAHGHDDDPGPVVELVGPALRAVDPEYLTDYAFLVLALVPERTRAILEDLLATTEPSVYDLVFARARTEGIAQGIAEGEARGRAAALLRILDRRGFAVPADVRARITGCADLARLESWCDRALVATDIDDLFV